MLASPPSPCWEIEKSSEALGWWDFREREEEDTQQEMLKSRKKCEAVTAVRAPGGSQVLTELGLEGESGLAEGGKCCQPRGGIRGGRTCSEDGGQRGLPRPWLRS